MNDADVQIMVFKDSVCPKIGEKYFSCDTFEEAVSWLKGIKASKRSVAIYLTKFAIDKHTNNREAMARSLKEELDTERVVIIVGWACGAAISREFSFRVKE